MFCDKIEDKKGDVYVIYGNYNNYNNYSNQNQTVAYNQNNNNNSTFNNNSFVYNRNYGNYQQNNTMNNQQNNTVFYNNYRMTNQNNLNNMSNNNRLYASYQNLNSALNLNTTNYNHQNNLNNMNNNRFYNNYQNYNYGMNTNFNNNYTMTMSHPNLNTSYQNQNNYNTMYNRYPNIYNAYQNNFNNLQSNPMGYTQGFYNNQQMFNIMETKKIQSDNEIVEDILNSKRKLEKEANGDENRLKELYYEKSIKLLHELINNKNRNIILDSNSLYKLLGIVLIGYEEYKQLKSNDYYEKNIYGKKIKEIYVLLNFLQKSQDIGKNSYFADALKSIEPIRPSENVLSPDKLGDKYIEHMNRLNENQIKLLNESLRNDITKINRYNPNNQQIFNTQIEANRKIKEEILSERKQIELTSTIDKEEQTRIYYEKCKNLIKEIINTNKNISEYQGKGLEFVLNIGYQLYLNYKINYEKYHLNDSQDKRNEKKLEENFMKIYVFLKFIKQSSSIGKSKALINPIITINSVAYFDNDINLTSLSIEDQTNINMALAPLNQ